MRFTKFENMFNQHCQGNELCVTGGICVAKYAHLKTTNKRKTKIYAIEGGNFRKFEVALNRMYRIVLNFAESCILSCLSKFYNKKNFTVPF